MKLFSTVPKEISKQSKQISDVLAVLAEVAEGRAEIRSTLVAVQKLEKRFKGILGIQDYVYSIYMRRLILYFRRRYRKYSFVGYFIGLPEAASGYCTGAPRWYWHLVLTDDRVSSLVTCRPCPRRSRNPSVWMLWGSWCRKELHEVSDTP
jgi:hypothetical protein